MAAASKGGGGGGAPKRRSVVLSDQWMDFADRTFDADDYSEGFFLTHSEAEADERCAEMMNLRYQTQDLLRQKVSSHYHMFMRGTEDIQHVEQDIAKLRRLVARMQESLKRLDGASAGILLGELPTPPSAQHNSNSRISMRIAAAGGGTTDQQHSTNRVSLRIQPANVFDGNLAASRLQQKGPSVSSSMNEASSKEKLPRWLINAPEDIERLVIEKQRGNAVTLIEKVRAFFSTYVPPGGASASGEHEILKTVNRRADEVADRVIKDLEEMARTILFDFKDMARQLKMLIILGKAATAVDFFIRNRGGIIERSLRLLEAGGDTLSYVTLLSERFFTLLTDACAAFDSLFADQPGKVKRTNECFARLVLWVDAEVRRYGALVGRQLSMTRRDLVGNKRLSVQNKGSDIGRGLALPSSSSSSFISEAPLPLVNAGASAPVTPHDYISASRSSLLFKMTAMPQSSGGTTGKLLGRGLILTGGGGIGLASTTTDAASVASSNGGSSGNTAVTVLSSGAVACDECFVTIGACLEVCFTLVGKLDPLGLPVRPSLANVLVEDLVALLAGVARAGLRRIEGLISKEEWRGASIASSLLTIKAPKTLTARDIEDEASPTGNGGDRRGSSIGLLNPPRNKGGLDGVKNLKTSSTAAATGTSTLSPSPSPSEPIDPDPQVSVLSSTSLLISEINSLVASWAMLKEPQGSKIHYSEEFGAELDGPLLKELLGLLRSYVEKVEARWSEKSAGPKVGVKKKLSPEELQGRTVAMESLEAVATFTLPGLHTWVKDPLVIVDPKEASAEITPVQQAYGRAIEALGGSSTSTTKAEINKPSAVIPPSPPSTTPPSTTGAATSNSTSSHPPSSAPKTPTSSFLNAAFKR